MQQVPTSTLRPNLTVQLDRPLVHILGKVVCKVESDVLDDGLLLLFGEFLRGVDLPLGQLNGVPELVRPADIPRQIRTLLNV